ncbi:hypothetical protein RUM43_008620 [Polyplax serrata]|uniref:Ig-like domain-containing protein n=1 Tax=Polyplax serrata TaxID=468196 RepID=A0AAN8PA27_POLSC
MKSKLIETGLERDRPKTPYLVIDGRRLDPGNLFIPVKENTELSVTCVVEGGNPPPTVKWSLLLSSNPEGSGVADETSNPPVDLNVTENLSREMSSNKVFVNGHTRSEARLENVMREHHNATVMCFAQHVTLPSSLNASLLLDVQCKFEL